MDERIVMIWEVLDDDNIYARTNLNNEFTMPLYLYNSRTFTNPLTYSNELFTTTDYWTVYKE